MCHSSINRNRMLMFFILWVMISNSLIIRIIGWFQSLFKSDYHITYWSSTKFWTVDTCLSLDSTWWIFYPLWPPFHLWLNNIPTLFIRMMDYEYLPHGLFIQFPLIPQIFHIFDMHDFKVYQISHSSHLWNRGGWHWYMCIHMKLIAVWHPFHLLI